MIWNKRVIISAILIIAAACFSVICIQEAAYVKSQYTTVSVRYRSESMKGNELKKALVRERENGSQKLPDITAWTQLTQAEIRNDTLGHLERLRLILFEGDMKTTAPMSLEMGSYVYSDDKSGCVIDKNSAYRLFGTEAAVGNTLVYQNKYYYVRGVIKTIVPMLVLPGNAETVYNNLEFYYQGRNREQGEALTEEFLLQNGLMQDCVILDGYFYGKILHTILALPIWILYAVVSILIIRFLWKKCRKLALFPLILYCSIGFIGILGYGIILYQLTGNPVYIPEKFIPTKFSDFEYFSRQGKRLKEQLQQLRYLMPNPKDVFLEQKIADVSHNIRLMLMLYISCFISCNLIQKKSEH